MTFEEFKSGFMLTHYWATMVATVEASPWHREANVAVHTEMVLAEYEREFAPIRSDLENTIARFALLFHDTGKPSAEETLEKKDGSGEVYRRYAGHEQDSAVAFSQIYVESKELQALLTPKEARAIRWIIEHHLPYGLKDVTKRKGLAQGTQAAMEEAGVTMQTFFDCLRSDSRGRISDDHAEKLANVEAWITEFDKVPTGRLVSRSIAQMVLLVGPSASGKTTYVKKRFDPETDAIISMDDWKDDFFNEKDFMFLGEVAQSPVERYEMIWKYANENEAEFKKFVRLRAASLVAKTAANHGCVFVDITNLSKKARGPWVELGRKHGMALSAVEFWNQFTTLVARQETRGDKKVPYNSIKQQVFAQTCAWLGLEVDQVEMEIGE